MRWNLSRWVFLAVCGLGGIAIGQIASMQWRGDDSTAKAAVPAPTGPITQSNTGAQSPNVVGPAVITYHNAPTPTAPMPEEMKYRGELADEIGISSHSLDKNRNRWYTFSLAGKRAEAEEAWRESEKRMGECAALLRAKVNRTAEAEFLKIQAGEPIAHPNLLNANLPDGAAISAMWNRVTRLQKIEQRVRNGTERIVYPPAAQ